MKDVKNDSSDITLLKDREWSIIADEPCRVIDFIPWGFIKDGTISTLSKTTPYASVNLECKTFSKHKIAGLITHKIDFIHLWTAFKERTVKQNEEVIIFWSKRYYKLKLMKFLPGFWPKLRVMVCQKGAFELMTDPNYRPELEGEARFMAECPIVDWKPSCWKI